MLKVFFRWMSLQCQICRIIAWFSFRWVRLHRREQPTAAYLSLKQRSPFFSNVTRQPTTEWESHQAAQGRLLKPKVISIAIPSASTSWTRPNHRMTMEQRGPIQSSGPNPSPTWRWPLVRRVGWSSCFRRALLRRPSTPKTRSCVCSSHATPAEMEMRSWHWMNQRQSYQPLYVAQTLAVSSSRRREDDRVRTDGTFQPQRVTFRTWSSIRRPSQGQLPWRRRQRSPPRPLGATVFREMPGC